jgi:hypothetical protein
MIGLTGICDGGHDKPTARQRTSVNCASSAAFVGRPETGMRYYTQRAGKSTVYDHYTGVGEVLAVHALDDAFSTLGRRVLVKRGSLFTLDDVTNYNLIFVGSPSENLSLRDIPGTEEFFFGGCNPVRVKAIFRSSARLRSQVRPALTSLVPPMLH